MILPWVRRDLSCIEGRSPVACSAADRFQPPPFVTLPKRSVPTVANARPVQPWFTRRCPGASSLTFDSLGLEAKLLRAIREQRYDAPTAVQYQAIPPILRGEDVLATAQTGTGKTASFTLPLLQRLMATPPSPDSRFRAVRALVLVPTRELALQVSESIQTPRANV